ncbi:protein Wnt-8a isoform X1 [Tribolium castaneum]|uniref:Protein Wnt n=1 Tax=Tribolium castaneum TaxID=7070 RepID=D7EKY4_TRICA|nr:PREDICTED: protein Wnt-8a isoform X1 [Tribolium castaneum]EFA11738.1 Protein wingless-like Protein [Tribolium castaneum]|eukprot:XP_971439.1 PREDICTED: protein Wnt-8a isoform X1 [Tribolium castaneum]
MSTKIFPLVVTFLLSINVSSCWSTTINSLFKSKTILQFNQDLNPVIIESVANGAQMAMDECRNVFKWDRWNCPQSAFSRQNNHLATKEKAYTNAIITAGIIYSITRDCSQGVIKGCGCDPKLRKNIYQEAKTKNLERDWTWGGCSDDSSFGEELVLKLLEDNEESSDAQAFINRHNNRIGREIIREKMLKTCKCHGVSGSCSFQTCWMQMPTFPEIAKQLRERYDRAIMISFERVQGALTLGNSARHMPLESAGDVLPNLLYLEKSPDFCLSNNSTGWPGTRGRTCSRTTSASMAERKSCRNLCRSCGFRVRKQEKKVTKRCNCKFIWCCEVECDVCVEYVNEFTCH